MKLSKEQQKLFWRIFGKACDLHGVWDAEEKEVYRHRLIRENTNGTSLKDVGRGAEFDKLMVALGREACDIDVVNMFYGSASRRYGRMVEDNIRKLCGNSGMSLLQVVAYAEKMLTQKNGRQAYLRAVPSWYEDLPSEELKFLLQATFVAVQRREKSRKGVLI